MPTAMRAGFLAFGFVAALMAGCYKSATTTPAGGAGSIETSGKPAGSGASNKLVGVWESVEEAKKGEPDEKATAEFKADGGLSIAMGPFEMVGTWKLAKEEGNSLTIDTEVTIKDLPGGKSDKKSFKITFDDANTMTMTPTDKPDPKKFKRKM